MTTHFVRHLTAMVLLAVGIVLAIGFLLMPTESTAVGCPTHADHWQLLGVWIPNYHSLGVDLGSLSLTWDDGCNHYSSYLVEALPGLAVALAGGWLFKTSQSST
ncbi:hypothetical protein [Halocatena halophila]|uniref:hypothetical protein n=1 Tax=Halocatena halophila TaxID=2814576 RepID=UPI002ED55D82